MDRARLTILFWFGWAAIYWLVYGYLGGIMHFYYLSTLAPAFAALAGIGVAALWERYRDPGGSAWWLPIALVVCALWQLHVHSSALGLALDALQAQREDWMTWLHIALFGGVALASAALVAGVLRRKAGQPMPRLAAGAISVGIAALLAVPLAWTASSVLLPGNGIMPSADLYRLFVASRVEAAMDATRFGKSSDTARLVAFLRANRDGERFLLSTSTTQLAAPVIIESGEPVMARGGFHGLDTPLTAETLARMVRERQVRFAMLGDVASVSRRMGADRVGKPVSDWIRGNGKLVDPALWRGARIARGARLYDLRPDAGWVQPGKKGSDPS